MLRQEVLAATLRQVGLGMDSARPRRSDRGNSWSNNSWSNHSWSNNSWSNSGNGEWR